MEPTITKEIVDGLLKVTDATPKVTSLTLTQLKQKLAGAQSAKTSNVAAGVALDAQITDLQDSIEMFPEE